MCHHPLLVIQIPPFFLELVRRPNKTLCASGNSMFYIFLKRGKSDSLFWNCDIILFLQPHVRDRTKEGTPLIAVCLLDPA
jgi:hypothetical protein